MVRYNLTPIIKAIKVAFFPGKSYTEEERSLIKEYAVQVKDMQKTKGLARCICYQEKFGNQDIALAMITAREEIEEVKRGGQEYVKQI